MAIRPLIAANDLSNFIIYDNISANQHQYDVSSETSNISDVICTNTYFDSVRPSILHETLDCSSLMIPRSVAVSDPVCGRPNRAMKGRKRLRRRRRICKNKEEAETQRLTHIFVERNRRKQMNENLAVLRSLMPASYAQRGDQASIVGGAIEFLKELEQLLQALEAQKSLLQQQQQQHEEGGGSHDNNNNNFNFFPPPPLAQFFTYPQRSCCPTPNPSEYSTLENSPAHAAIEVTLIDTHANLRILSKRRPNQLVSMVAGFQSLHLAILLLNVTTLDPLVFYSFNLKVEEGCSLHSVDDIASAVHHMLKLIDEEAVLA